MHQRHWKVQMTSQTKLLPQCTVFLSLIIIITADYCLGATTRRTSKDWVLKGELPERPERITHAYPLSDQQNKGTWSLFVPFSDEFEGEQLDEGKWWPKNPTWLGRQPGYFCDKNVDVKEGKLHLSMKQEEPAEMPKK
jgi:hypothetical protein